MKKILLSTLILGFSSLVWGQAQVKSSVSPADGSGLINYKNSSHKDKLNSTKTLACVDTIRYPQAKEQLLGAPSFYTFGLWTNDNEAISQTFLLSGSTIGITGVEFFGRKLPGGTASVTVRASVYNVDASNNPTTEIAFANITITDTVYTYRQVNFSPVNVSGNYAVVIKPTNAGGVVQFYVNNAAPNQTQDENLSRAKSDWYTSSNGNWVNIPTYTVSGFTGGPFDFEPLVAPKITYTITTDFAASPTPSCLGTPVNFTNNTSPTSVLSSRFYNYQMFKSHFSSVPDSTYVYALGGTPLVWNGSTTYTYPTAANHTPKLYTLGGFWNSCLDSATKTVTVNPLPTVVANASSMTVCAGSQVTLTGGGANSYTWDNGVTNGIAFTPTATATYTVTGTSTSNCQNTAQVTVTVNPLPTVTANASSMTVCAGDQVTLAGGGANSYAWDNGVTNGIAFTPTATATYTVTGTNTSGCQNTAQVTVTVNPSPTVVANTTATTICAGDQVTLTGSGATTYTWDNGVVDGVAFTPTGTTTYSVTGTSGSCTGSDQITITVNPLPTVVANATATTICAGDQVTLTGGGATTYTWDNGVVDGVAFTPTATTTYTVTGTSNNCQNTAQVTVTIASAITVTANATATTICAGDQVTLTGGGATSYTWDNGVTNGVAFTPTGTTTYSVTGTSGSCTGSDQITITVNPLPTVVANATATTVCAGDQVTLTGGGATTYTWDNSVVDGVAFTPTATATYTVTGTSNNCQNTDQVTVTVTTVDATTTKSGTTITANNSNATYQWVDCDNSNQPISGATNQSFTPTVTGNYAVIVTENGCSETSTCENIIITGINDIAANNNISIYPNPVNDIFTISSSDDLSGTVVKIIAITGQTLVEKTITLGNTATFDMSVYATGLYFVEINQNGVLSTLKVIKK